MGALLDIYSRAVVPAFLESLPGTDGGLDAVRATLDRMVAIVRRYKADVGMANVARLLLTDCGIRDVRREKSTAIRIIQNWVRDSIAYVPDPDDVEMLQTPPRTIEIGTGDCDDQAILVATLLATIGFKTRFIAVGGQGQGWDDTDEDPPPYSHVLAQVRMGQSWLCLETIVPNVDPGWCPPGITRFMVGHV